MSIALITGSCGLIGSEAARFFADKGFKIVGIDNDLRSYFFGKEASTEWNLDRLETEISQYTHHRSDIRDVIEIEKIFSRYGAAIQLVIHCAAQPSHDWAAREPFTDFTVNANGTLNLLEMTRKHCPDAVFIFTSTNKVYGDTPNHFPLEETPTRWEIAPTHPYHLHGIDERLSIDASTHSLFGASKVAADILVQEYGRYFSMKTVAFRGGCLTGPGHSGTQLHGFLAYLVKCVITGTPYSVFGYKGKQVRDNIHSFDLVNAFWHFFQKPRSGEVYNIGGSRHSNCSMLEAIAISERLVGKQMNYQYCENARKGDHIWWVSDVRKFRSHYPDWTFRYNIESIIQEIYEGLSERMEHSQCR
ncbi:MAG TPA: NAD-dependent epimerase/dehydratase family protein [Chlamydiales bacterium]|jgi:CDP-paratose 2-epimerase